MEKERAKLLDELLNQIDRAYDLMEEYDSMSRKYGEVILYQVEAHLIKYIGEHPGTTVSDIAQDLNKTSSAASQMVKKLQTKGLIEQIKNEKNNGKNQSLEFVAHADLIFFNYSRFAGYEGLF